MKQDYTMIRNCKSCGKPFKITSSKNIHCLPCRTSHCAVCGKKIIKSLTDTRVTCVQCRGKARLPPILTCNYCGKKFPQRGGVFTKYCGNECRYTAARKIHTFPNHRTYEYKKWRRIVFKRDDYKCQHCGSEKSLHAHHVKTMREYPSLAYVAENGITLCWACHTIAHGERPMNPIGAKKLKCAACGKTITGRGKTPYCRSCALRKSEKVKKARSLRNRGKNGQFI